MTKAREFALLFLRYFDEVFDLFDLTSCLRVVRLGRFGSNLSKTKRFGGCDVIGFSAVKGFNKFYFYIFHVAPLTNDFLYGFASGFGDLRGVAEGFEADHCGGDYVLRIV